MTLSLHTGSCLDVLPTLAAESVQCCVTSPPYWGLRDYGVDGQIGLEPTPEVYVSKLVDVFREVRRVLREDGTLWLNLGDSYATQGGSREYGSSDGNTGRGPGVGGIRRPATGLKPKDLVGVPWRVALALQADGWWLRSDIIWAKPNPMPESVTDRPTKAHEYVFLLTKAEDYFYDAEAIKEPSADPVASRKRYESAFGGKKARAEAGDSGIDTRTRPVGMREFDGTRNARSVWTIGSEPYPGAHFAVMPSALVQPCILAGSRIGDTVLDPFAGTGTVGRVAQDLGRHAVLIDLNPKYVELARERNAQTGLLDRVGRREA